jgi:hypothetical protein
MTFEMKLPYMIDMNLCSWYNPRRSYLVWLSMICLQVTIHRLTILPLFQITYMEDGKAVIYIKSTNLIRPRMCLDKLVILERSMIKDCRTTGNHLQIIGRHAPALSLTLPIHMPTTAQNLKNIMHTCWWWVSWKRGKNRNVSRGNRNDSRRREPSPRKGNPWIGVRDWVFLPGSCHSNGSSGPQMWRCTKWYYWKYI